MLWLWISFVQNITLMFVALYDVFQCILFPSASITGTQRICSGCRGGRGHVYQLPHFHGMPLGSLLVALFISLASANGAWHARKEMQNPENGAWQFYRARREKGKCIRWRSANLFLATWRSSLFLPSQPTPKTSLTPFNTPAQLQSLASILSSLAESSFVSRFHLAFVRLEH